MTYLTEICWRLDLKKHIYFGAHWCTLESKKQCECFHLAPLLFEWSVEDCRLRAAPSRWQLLSLVTAHFPSREDKKSELKNAAVCCLFPSLPLLPQIDKNQQEERRGENLKPRWLHCQTLLLMTSDFFLCPCLSPPLLPFFFVFTVQSILPLPVIYNSIPPLLLLPLNRNGLFLPLSVQSYYGTFSFLLRCGTRNRPSCRVPCSAVRSWKFCSCSKSAFPTSACRGSKLPCRSKCCATTEPPRRASSGKYSTEPWWRH